MNVWRLPQPILQTSAFRIITRFIPRGYSAEYLLIRKLLCLALLPVASFLRIHYPRSNFRSVAPSKNRNSPLLWRSENRASLWAEELRDDGFGRCLQAERRHQRAIEGSDCQGIGGGLLPVQEIFCEFVTALQDFAQKSHLNTTPLLGRSFKFTERLVSMKARVSEKNVLLESKDRMVTMRNLKNLISSFTSNFRRIYLLNSSTKAKRMLTFLCGSWWWWHVFAVIPFRNDPASEK